MELIKVHAALCWPLLCLESPLGIREDLLEHILGLGFRV